MVGTIYWYGMWSRHFLVSIAMKVGVHISHLITTINKTVRAFFPDQLFDYTTYKFLLIDTQIMKPSLYLLPKVTAVTRALIGERGGGGEYSYILVLPDEFLLKSVVKKYFILSLNVKVALKLCKKYFIMNIISPFKQKFRIWAILPSHT